MPLKTTSEEKPSSRSAVREASPSPCPNAPTPNSTQHGRNKGALGVRQCSATPRAWYVYVHAESKRAALDAAAWTCFAVATPPARNVRPLPQTSSHCYGACRRARPSEPCKTPSPALRGFPCVRLTMGSTSLPPPAGPASGRDGGRGGGPPDAIGNVLLKGCSRALRASGAGVDACARGLAL